jgi:hypothetical protein
MILIIAPMMDIFAAMISITRSAITIITAMMDIFAAKTTITGSVGLSIPAPMMEIMGPTTTIFVPLTYVIAAMRHSNAFSPHSPDCIRATCWMTRAPSWRMIPASLVADRGTP